MSVTHDFECAAHGYFESRAKKPKCPKGCTMVKKVFLQPVGHVSARTRTGDRLVREMATTQGLSDLSTSPSRPGGSVMDRLRAKGLKPTQMPMAVDASKYLGALTHKSNELTNVGFGRKYNEREWKTTEDGKRQHVGATAAMPDFRPSASVDRVRDK